MTSDPNFLVPREHGAYGQLAFPLITSFLVAGVSTVSLLIAASVVAGFLAHEPLLVLVGRRGARAQRQQRRHVDPLARNRYGRSASVGLPAATSTVSVS